MSDPKHTNRLVDETSPYLLQHAHNPVAWYPWGEEALATARKEDKPILLSVGYAACHWCHVMERESFENEEIAALMNELFVPVKVDREERPEIDEIYMNAVQMMTGSGGWPMTVFLTPSLKPFWGGTYFPPDDRWGRPGFRTVLTDIARVYREERDKVEDSAEALTERIQSLARVPKSGELLDREPIRAVARELGARFDSREGGFSQAPKFPPSGALSLLLSYYDEHRDPDTLAMAELTLSKMAGGGMYDQLGGGFHRYATDDRWLVPHFEKMLYDNALLVPVYLDAFRITGKEVYATTARETLDWVLREMQSEEGGYYSTLDADSEGEEGKFYVWSKQEIDELLGSDAELFSRAYDVTASGNWEGKNILNLPRPLTELAEKEGIEPEALSEQLAPARQTLLETRNERVWPGLDDKVLTSWNGLMIRAMTRGFRVLGESRFLDSARKAARFVSDRLYEDGRLAATWRNGRAKHKGYLDDYAFLLGGLVELYASDFDITWLEWANDLADALRELFWDDGAGGFFFTGADHETLITRSKTGYDGALPSGNGMAATYLFALSVYTGSPEQTRLARDTLRAFQAQFVRSPSGFTQMIAALDFYLADKRELAIVGSQKGASEALSRLWRLYTAHTTIALLDTDSERSESVAEKVPLLAGKTPGEDPTRPRFYLCRDYACQAPTDDLDGVVTELRAALE